MMTLVPVLVNLHGSRGVFCIHKVIAVVDGDLEHRRTHRAEFCPKKGLKRIILLSAYTTQSAPGPTIGCLVLVVANVAWSISYKHKKIWKCCSWKTGNLKK